MSRPFQIDRNKHSRGIKDIYKKERSYEKDTTGSSKSDRLREGFKKWTSFYRANPHRFAEEYLGVKLHLFQKIMLYLMFKNSFVMVIAARGLGKSWISALYVVIHGILFPNSLILVVSGTKGQARLIVDQKIEKELMEFPNIAREIKSIRSSNNDVRVIFQNGSTIEAVTSTDSARGYRAHLLLADEFRLIPEKTYSQVLRPFLNIQRRPPYTHKPEYEHLVEENKEILISSAWYKSHWIWDRFKSFLTNMLRGREYSVVSFPYQLSLRHGLLSERRVELMRSEDSFDPTTLFNSALCQR